MQNIQIDSDSPIVQVAICDPYVCAQTQSGAVITWALRETKGTLRLALNKNAISCVSQRSNLSRHFWVNIMIMSQIQYFCLL